MKKIAFVTKHTFFWILLLVALPLQAQQNMPRLQQQGTATQLIVDDKPFLILGGELGNSTAASFEQLESACKTVQEMHLNTLLIPAYWDLIEPQQGVFDFTHVNKAIDTAQEHSLKVVFLWFGSWKNSMSCYAPLWIKENYKKYPRAVTKAGKPLEIMSAFSPDNRDADKNAFVRFMQHLAEYDRQKTVIMIQVENEIGMLESAREYGTEANKAFNSAVPQQFISYLTKNKKQLRPQLLKLWEQQGFKTKGNWGEIFGNSLEAEEVFMAYHYGLYVQEIAKAGKEAYNLPMFLNAALNSRGRKPGEYPSAGPLAHLLDVWRAAAPAVDFLAPDIYDPGFSGWCAQYHVAGNPLFIPEIRLAETNSVHALYAFGEHDAMGFCPFSIEDVREPKHHPLTKSYDILHQLTPLLLEKQGKGKTNGILLDGDTKKQVVNRNGYTMTFSHGYTLPWENPKTDEKWLETGALLIELSETEYIIAGTGIAVTFENAKNDGFTAGIGYVDEVKFENGKMIPVQRLSGDQTHQGRHLRIPVGQWSIQYIKLYNYK